MAFPGAGLTISTLGVVIASDQGAVPARRSRQGRSPIRHRCSCGRQVAVSASVTAPNATPCVFTWTRNPLVNEQTCFLLLELCRLGLPPGYFVVGVSGNTFQLARTYGGTGMPSTLTGSGITAMFDYSPNQLIASSTLRRSCHRSRLRRAPEIHILQRQAQ